MTWLGHAVLDDIHAYADNVLSCERRAFVQITAARLLTVASGWRGCPACGEVMSAIQLTDPQLDLFVLAFLNHSRDSIKEMRFRCLKTLSVWRHSCLWPTCVNGRSNGFRRHAAGLSIEGRLACGT